MTSSALTCRLKARFDPSISYRAQGKLGVRVVAVKTCLVSRRIRQVPIPVKGPCEVIFNLLMTLYALVFGKEIKDLPVYVCGIRVLIIF